MVSLNSNEMSQSSRSYVGLINQLRSCGMQLDVDLPRIAVIGKQSAGKSSLIEAICGVKVPRDTGTCTRCPIEMRLETSSSAWKCQVSIRFEVDAKGVPLDAISEIPFGSALDRPEQVEDTLRRAQLAILNPSTDSKYFLTEDVSTLRATMEQEFSSNVVVVSVSGPEVAHLSLVDLPGLVANTEQHVIDMVQTMVEKNVKGSCIILTAITVGDDIENQSAAYLARKVDPDGMRTIGVLTKPDLLPPGEEETWMALLRNESPKHKLLHGYYCTKQPNGKQLKANISFAEARTRETAFFQKGIWTDQGSVVQSRLGTHNLIKALSQHLSELILKNLPQLDKEIGDAYLAVNKEIDQLPRPPSDNPVQELISLCMELGRDLAGYSYGRPPALQVVQKAASEYLNFEKEIKETLPRMIPFEKKDDRRERYVKAQFFNDLFVEHKDIITMDGKRCLFVEHKDITMDGKGCFWDLDTTKALIDSARGREMPLDVPSAAKTQMLTSVTQSWKDISHQCLYQVVPSIREVLAKLVEQHFGRFQSNVGGLVLSILNRYVDSLVGECTMHLAWLHSLEDEPFTMNEHFLSDVRQTQRSKFQAARSSIDAQTLNAQEDMKNEALAALQYLGFRIKEQDLFKLLPTDSFERELDVMAYCQGYFTIASKRIIDDVPRTIDRDLIRPLKDQIVLDHLIDKLNLTDLENIANARNLLAEPVSVSAKRADLIKRKDRLENATVVLKQWGVTSLNFKE